MTSLESIPPQGITTYVGANHAGGSGFKIGSLWVGEAAPEPVRAGLLRVRQRADRVIRGDDMGEKVRLLRRWHRLVKAWSKSRPADAGLCAERARLSDAWQAADRERNAAQRAAS